MTKETIGPVQHGGASFENTWDVPPGAKHVTIRQSNSVFYVEFDVEEPDK